MKRYKVAIVSDMFLPYVGGLEVHMHDLALELGRAGHEAHVICVEPRLTEQMPFPVHRLPVPRLPFLKRTYHPSSLKIIRDKLSEQRFDVVHAHCIFSPLAHASTYVAGQLGIPSVFTLHSVLAGPAGHFLKHLNRRLPWAAWPTVLTGVSRFVTEELRQVSGRDDVQVLLNAVRMEHWSSSRDIQKTPRVVSVLRMMPRKRPIDLIRMIPNVLAQLPRAAWPVFTVIGDGPERGKVEKEVRKLGVEQHVELTGLLDRTQIRDILCRSTVFALPSYLEALPLAVIEARAAGLPVVARTPNGVSEIIEHGRQGFLAEDTAAFERHLVTLLSDDSLREQMGSRASLDLERFTWKASIERHERIYAEATRRFASGARADNWNLPASW